MKPFIRNLMRMSVYQIFYLDKVPVSAVVNEGVKLVKKRKFGSLSGFVNGVLRQIDRHKEEIIYPNKEQDLEGYLTIMYSIPEWIIKEWLETYSEDVTEKICMALNKRAQVCIRINTLCTTKETLQKILKEERVICEEGHLLEEALYLKEVGNLQQLPSFKKGMWTVQDESAMLVARVMKPKPGEKILDMCSAPGGKSLHMAELMANSGEVVSADLHAHKLQLIEKNSCRMGINIIKPVLWDGTQWREEWEGAFDKVLLDAPCSGFGIMKRKPDIRYNKSPQDLQEIVELQKQLAFYAVKYVKEGGLLVYSTCTISKRENDEIAAYITEDLGLEYCNIADTIPKGLHTYIKNKGTLQIFPFVADTDGFFIACFKKKRS